MKSFGTLALYASLGFTIVGLALSALAGLTQQRKYILASRWSVYGTFWALALAATLLMQAILGHDYSIQYVQQFSDESMPLFYLVGSLWGGQAGSLLFWAANLALFLALAVYINRERYQEFMPWVSFSILAVLLGILLIMTHASDPFQGYEIIDSPTIGKGLNPMLQTPLMVVHPPSLLTGYATMAIPYGFAVAALITGNLSSEWVTAARKWILVSWLFLSVGNILGGMWAYDELGWGGYWAWDAVENASFMPWLTSTALIHSLMIQERRGILKRWNIILMFISFLLTIFGTYITRSGLIESVHTFAQSDVGNYFLALLLVMIGVSVVLFVWRWPKMKSTRSIDSPISKEATFILNNWLLLAMTIVVFFGTMWPRIKEGFFGQTVSIGPSWFNRWMVPLGIMLLILMGIGTLISWRKATKKNLQRNFTKPIIATLVGTPSLAALYWFGRGTSLGIDPSPNDVAYALVGIAAVVFVASATIEEFVRGIQARLKRDGVNVADAFVQLILKQRRRYGGYLVHLGIVFCFFAFVGNAFKVEKDVSLMRGESVTIGDYQLTFEGVAEQNRSDKRLVEAKVAAYKNGDFLYDLHPGKAIFHARREMPTSEIDIHSTPLEDFYVALVDYDETGSRIALKIFIAPFTWWFWFGGVVLVLGTFVALWPDDQALQTLKVDLKGFSTTRS